MWPFPFNLTQFQPTNQESTMAASFICRRYVLNDHDLSDAFDLLDLDKDGELSRAEIAALLRTIKVEPNLNELKFIFDETHSENGKINKDQFLEYMKQPSIYQITVNELANQFTSYDHDKDGYINLEELGQILSSTAGITDQEIINHVFKLADSEGKGLLSYDQFLQLIRS
ncbi:EF hand [Aphelenchoides bicaudatus]|nr:EF hand [Aphelenchoides bicaudatus]